MAAAIRPGDAPVVESAGIRHRLSALTGPWQFLALFVVTIGGIYAGIFSPTEAASIRAFGAITLGVAGRALTRRELANAMESAVITSSMLFMIIIGANLFSNFMVQTQLPVLLANAASSFALPRMAVSGQNLFVIQAQAPEIRITSIYRGIVPFLAAPLLMIILMFLFPQLALWLPQTLYR